MHLKRFLKHGDTETRKPGKPYMGRSDEAVKAILLENRSITPEGCWEWTKSRQSAGYGMVSHRGRQQGTHRVAYTLFVGPIPDGMFVCHRCDNPPCFNPEHLFIGEPRVNHADMTSKGRAVTGFTKHLSGESAPGAKLTEVDVRAIRASTEPLKMLAERYGVYESAISKIRNRHTWRDVA